MTTEPKTPGFVKSRFFFDTEKSGDFTVQAGLVASPENVKDLAPWI